MSLLSTAFSDQDKRFKAALVIGGLAGVGVLLYTYHRKQKAPYLRRYFRLLAKHEQQFWALSSKEVANMHRRLKSMEVGTRTDVLQEVAIETVALLNDNYSKTLPKREAELERTVEKSFDWHDKDGNGVLDEDESREFVKHFVEELQPWAQSSLAVASANVELLEMLDSAFSSGLALQDDGKVGEDSQRNKTIRLYTKKASFTIEELLASANEQASEMVQRGVEYFMEHKEECFQASFRVLDANNNGKLERNEVLDALLPTTAKGKEFLDALHLRIGPELVQCICMDFGLSVSS